MAQFSGSLIRLTAAVLLAVTALFAGPAVRAADAPDTPFLRIETGMHGAAINAMALLGDGRLLTVSDDKTARLWSLERATPLPVVLRPPVGPEDEGALYAAAAAGSLIAVAGRTGMAWDGQAAVYLFRDPANPVMLGRIAGMPAPVTALAFSADGAFLAVGMHGRGGLRVYDMKAQKLVLNDTDYTAAVTGLDFAADGRLAAVAADRGVRLYAPGYAAAPQRNALDVQPWRLRFSPDGTLLAVGSETVPQVAVFDGRTLDRRATQGGGAGRSDGLSLVAWTAEGALLAAGRYADGATWYLRQWTTPARPDAPGSDHPLARRTVTDLLALGDGRLAYATAEPRWGVLSAPGGREAIGEGPAALDFRSGYRDWLRLSPDGATVEVAFDRAAGTVARFTLTRRRLDAPAKPAAGASGLAAPQIKAGRLAVADFVNSPRPQVGGKLVPLDANEAARSAAVAPDGAGAALGSDFYLRWVADGRVLWRNVTGSPVWGVTVSGDGRVVVAALGDGTLRWYATRNGRELLALFIHADGRRWVAWTPDGYFDHSPPDPRTGESGDTLIGYHVNRGKTKEGEVVRVEQMYRAFARRDLLMARFRDQDAVIPGPARPAGDGAGLGGSGEVVDGRPPGATTAPPRPAAAAPPGASQPPGLSQAVPLAAAPVASALKRGLPPRIDVTELCEGDTTKGATRGLCAAPTVLRGAAARSVEVDAAASPAAGEGGETGATTVKIPEVTLTVRLSDRGGGIGRSRVVRNGSVIDSGSRVVSDGDGGRVETHTVALEPGMNTIEVSAFTPGTEIEARSEDRSILRIRYNPPLAAGGATDGAGGKRPVLYALAIGISDYRLPALRLENAARDAKGIIDTMLQGRLESYDRLVTYTLLDGHATREAIQRHLDLIAEAARPEDAFLLFLAGHGEAVDGRYYFAPVEMGTGDPALVARMATMSPAEQVEAKNTFFRTQGLAQDDLSARLARIKAGRGLLILDTCYSATLQIADANATMSDQFSRAVGRPILAAAVEGALDGGQSSTVGHGLFTSYVLSGLRGKADFNRNGRVDIMELASYVMDGVESEAQRMDAVQEPTFTGVSVRRFDVSAPR